MASSAVVSSSSRTRSALESFFTPASIAVIGATEREGSVGQSAEQEQCSKNDVSDSVAKYYHLILQTDTSRTLSDTAKSEWPLSPKGAANGARLLNRVSWHS